MVDHINSNREVHIVTIEDPIEVLHFDKIAMVNQREVRVDTEDFATALRAAMRQDPDVILVGEMRDAETVKAALAASETGHFVMSTLHTTDAPGDDQPHHRLLPAARAEAGPALPRRRAARHHLPAAGAARRRRGPVRGDGDRRQHRPDRRRHRRPGQDRHDPALVAEGAYYGMQTFDQHLVALIRDGVITLEAAMAASTSPHDLTVELRRLGSRRLTAGGPLHAWLLSTAVLHAACGPAGRRHLDDHAPRARRAVPRRFELTRRRRSRRGRRCLDGRPQRSQNTPLRLVRWRESDGSDGPDLGSRPRASPRLLLASAPSSTTWSARRTPPSRSAAVRWRCWAPPECWRSPSRPRCGRLDVSARGRRDERRRPGRAGPPAPEPGRGDRCG